MCALTSIFQSITLTLQTLPFCCRADDSGLPDGGTAGVLRLSTPLLFSNLIFNSVTHLYPVVFPGSLIFLGSVVWMSNFHNLLHCRLRMSQPQSALSDPSHTVTSGQFYDRLLFAGLSSFDPINLGGLLHFKIFYCHFRELWEKHLQIFKLKPGVLFF